MPWLFLGGRWRAGAGQLNAGIMRDHICNPHCAQSNRAVVIALPEQRHGFAPDAANPAIGEDRFETVAYRRPIFVVFNREQDQRAAVGALAADPPCLIETHGVIEYVLAVGAGISALSRGRDYGEEMVRRVAAAVSVCRRGKNVGRHFPGGVFRP